MLQTKNFPYRVRLGLQRVFNLQMKGVGGGFIYENIEFEFQTSQPNLYLLFSVILLLLLL